MNNRTESDEWLMGQVRRGQRDALEKLVRRYASPLLTFLHRMCGDRHKGEELFQEAFLRVWTKRSQYKLDKPFRSWLFAIAANLCRADHRRPSLGAVSLDALPAGKMPAAPVSSGMSSGAADDGPENGQGGSPVMAAIAVETAQIVEDALGLLPPQQRMAVVMRVWNGMKYGEIAEIAGTEESTVRSNMLRGLETLRRHLTPRLQ